MDWTLDRLVPVFDRRTRYSRRVTADPGTVWRAARTLTTQDLVMLRPLMALRHGTSPKMAGTLADGTTPIPLLSIVEGQEFVFATVGKFWKPSSPKPLAGERDPERFLDFDEPGWAKAAMSIRVDPDGDGTQLSTETRVHATSMRARKLFLLYWPMVFLGSKLIRIDILRAIARRAERDVKGQET